MKSLMIAALSIMSLLSLQAFAGQVELGKYRAVDADTKSVVATFELRADGTVNLSVKTPDFTMPKPGCEGTYRIDTTAEKFYADVKCPTPILPEASVVISTENVNPQSVRTEEGAQVNLIIDALGEDPIAFLLKKAD